MRIISVVSIILGVLSGVIGLISRIRLVPIFGVGPQAFVWICMIFFLLAIAINTLPEDL